MRLRGILIVVVLLTAVSASACGSDPDISTNGGPAPTAPPAGAVDLSRVAFADLTGEAEPEVDALDNVFKAKYIEVKAGSTVTFRNDGRNTHNLLPVVDDEFTPIEADDFEPGTESSVTFDEAGDYAYYCSLHGTTTKGMVGAVRVVE